MQTFVAERNLKGISMDQLADAQKRAIESAARMSETGRRVQYLQRSVVPDTGAGRGLFEAESAADEEQVNRDANVPFTRVLPAMDLAPAA